MSKIQICYPCHRAFAYPPPLGYFHGSFAITLLAVDFLNDSLGTEYLSVPIKG